MNEQTRQRARQIGRNIVAHLEGRGVKAGAVVRGYESDTVAELKNLPATSARLGVVLHTGKATPEIVEQVATFAPVVFTGVNVIVCEVEEAQAEEAA